MWVLLRSQAGERAGLEVAEEERLFLLLEENGGWRRGLCCISETISVQLTRPETGGTRSGKPSPSSWSRRGIAPWRLLLFTVSHARQCRQAEAQILVYSCCSFSPPALGEKGFCAQEECECYSLDFGPFSVHFSSVARRVHLFATPWTAARQASLPITNSRSLLKLTCIESLMPSNHFILCPPLLLLPSVFPSIRVFSNESVLHIKWLRVL